MEPIGRDRSGQPGAAAHRVVARRRVHARGANLDGARAAAVLDGDHKGARVVELAVVRGAKRRGEAKEAANRLGAALDVGADEVANSLRKQLEKRFPDSQRVKRLEGMCCEAQGKWAEVSYFNSKI